jgi:hypothetical protein
MLGWDVALLRNAPFIDLAVGGSGPSKLPMVEMPAGSNSAQSRWVPDRFLVIAKGHSGCGIMRSGIMRSCLRTNFGFNRRDPDGIPIPRPPDAARRAYKLRQRLVGPRARILLGVCFCWNLNPPQTCNAFFAALLFLRCSILAKGTGWGTISTGSELSPRGGRAT